MGRTASSEESRRESTLKPLFSTLTIQGRTRAWLAKKLDVSRPMLSNYEHGARRIPPWFIERACEAIGVPPSIIQLSEPLDWLVQRPRKTASTPNAPKPRHTTRRKVAKNANATDNQPTHQSARRTRSSGSTRPNGNHVGKADNETSARVAAGQTGHSVARAVS